MSDDAKESKLQALLKLLAPSATDEQIQECISNMEQSELVTYETVKKMGRSKTRSLAYKEMHYYATREGRDTNIFWHNACSTFLTNGGKQEAIDRIREEADLMLPILNRICRDIRRKDANESIDELLLEGQNLIQSFRGFRAQMNVVLDQAMHDWLSKVDSQRGKQQPVPRTQNTPITELTPRPAWDLVIDESGNSFMAKDQSERNCYLGVLAPSDDTVPPLNLHAVDYHRRVRQTILEDLISRPSWSMFGIRHSQLTPLQGDLWIDGISEIIAWVLRLLPIDENGTKLTVFVEHRRNHVPGSEQHRLERVLLQSLARVNPERAGQFDLNIRFVNKYIPEKIEEAHKRKEYYSTHRWLAYADLTSNLWYSDRDHYMKMIRESGLLHRFLHEDLTTFHQNLFDAHSKKGEAVLSGDEWTKMLLDIRGRQSKVIDHISDLWKKRTANDPKQWARLMDELQRHLYSKAINMNLLIDQTSWLTHVNTSKTYELSPRDQLVFEMCRLAKRNHDGAIIKPKEVQELQAQQAALVNEDIRLICFLDLHLAIQFTHTFAFERGFELMQKWANEETRMIGINYKGRVLSTMGQMMAFQGQSDEAISYFEQAIATFEMLSSTKERLDEQRHTRSYKIIAMIDDAGFSNKEIEDELLKLFSPESNIQGINNLCKHLISSNADADKYIHHLFLRYLYFRQPETLVNQYTNGKKHWKDGNHHPWSWIQIYRGLLLIQRNRPGVEWLEKGLAEVSFKGVELPVGLALLLITSQHGGRRNGKPIKSGFIQRKFNELKGKIPNAADFVEQFESIQSGDAGEPRAWLPSILPFNFH